VLSIGFANFAVAFADLSISFALGFSPLSIASTCNALRGHEATEPRTILAFSHTHALSSFIAIAT